MLRALWRAVPALLFAVAGLATAQDYPSKPITFVVPWGAGGGIAFKSAADSVCINGLFLPVTILKLPFTKISIAAPQNMPL